MMALTRVDDVKEKEFWLDFPQIKITITTIICLIISFQR